MSNKRKYYYSHVRRRRRRQRTKMSKTKRCVLIISAAALFILLVCGVITLISRNRASSVADSDKILPKLTLKVQLIDINKYSRPGIALKKVNGIVVHYTANPGTDAEDNRNYFNNLPRLNKEKKKPVYASSHFVIGLEGQIVQCIPTKEMAYASNDRNSDTIAIECCHPDNSGKFNSLTYESLVELLAYLCVKFDLDEQDIIRHYDVTGKLCPKYYVKNEEKWEKLKQDVKMKLQNL